MSRRHRVLSTANAALTANALHPASGGNPFAVPSFFAGWLTSELAPQLLALTAVTTAVRAATTHGRTDRDDRIGYALDAATLAGLGLLVSQGVRARAVVEDALIEGLADDYVARLDPAPVNADRATPWRQVLMPWRVKHPDVRRVRDVTYGPDGSGRRGRLDLYLPRDAGTRRPVLLQLHGGAWVIGAKEQQGLPLMTHLAARGWVCVAPNYPLSPRAAWPEHLVGVKRALAWVREHIEEYGGDPSFVAVTGGSAGGHLAAMLALTPNEPRYQPGFESADTRVQACVPFYGVYDLAGVLGTRAARMRRDYFLAPRVFKSRDPRVAEDASPLLHVSADAPPFFVVHGAHDSLVPVAEAREVVRRLREVSRQPVVYAELPGGQHAFDVFASVRSAHVIRGVERFLRWVHAGERPAAAADGTAGRGPAVVG